MGFYRKKTNTILGYVTLQSDARKARWPENGEECFLISMRVYILSWLGYAQRSAFGKCPRLAIQDRYARTSAKGIPPRASWTSDFILSSHRFVALCHARQGMQSHRVISRAAIQKQYPVNPSRYIALDLETQFSRQYAESIH